MINEPSSGISSGAWDDHSNPYRASVAAEQPTRPTVELPPAWAATASRGLELLLISWLLEALSGGGQSQWELPEWSWQLLSLIPSALELVGFWMVTTPVPQGPQPEPARIARLATRWLAVAFGPLAVIDAVGVIAGAWSSEAMIPWIMPVLALHIAVFAVYMASLARRLGRPQLVWKSYAAFWGLALGLVSFTACIPLMAAIDEQAAPDLALLAAVGLTTLATLVFAICSVVVIFRYRSALRAVRNEQVTDVDLSESATQT